MIFQEFYDVSNAAGQLKTCQQTVRRLIRDGKLDAVYIGDRYLIPIAGENKESQI